MRHPEPKIVTLYRDAIKNPPRVCHTCEYYTQDGLCQEFNAEPPIDFATTQDTCDLWCEEIPL